MGSGDFEDGSPAGLIFFVCFGMNANGRRRGGMSDAFRGGNLRVSRRHKQLRDGQAKNRRNVIELMQGRIVFAGNPLAHGGRIDARETRQLR